MYVNTPTCVLAHRVLTVASAITLITVEAILEHLCCRPCRPHLSHFTSYLWHCCLVKVFTQHAVYNDLAQARDPPAVPRTWQRATSCPLMRSLWSATPRSRQITCRLDRHEFRIKIRAVAGVALQCVQKLDPILLFRSQGSFNAL